jgi:glycosyltransferase involved in cell wall biosynthesis
VTARLPGVRLVLAGAGPLLPALQARAAGLGIDDRVHFAGQVDHDALPDLLRSASIYVQTSRHEAQGMALLEAAACGLPVVGTPVGVLPEVGLAADDEDGLVRCLSQLLCDAELRRDAARRARDQVMERFRLADCVETFVQRYANLAAGDSSRRFDL